ncbi:MAG: MBL fold metallo-hydrolase RNA specificity domain-containing protein [Rubripirellula sp.]
MKLIHHGAYDGVTGSCHQLVWGDKQSVLVDCGIFQGDDARKHPNPEIEFSLEGIQSLLLTHVHIDHVGRVPYLMGAGFDKPIYCSYPTARLLPLVMEDSLKIGFTRSRNLISKFLKKVGKLLRPLSYGHWHAIEGGVDIRLRPAGHVLGSTIFEVRLPDGKIVVFSGDVGTGHDPLLRKPTSPPEADLLVLESTYGDKLHETPANRQHALEAVLRHTLQNKGVTIIPAFSLGRTQALLYEMNGIFERLQEEEGRSLLKRVDVIVDSPLASRFTELYKSMKDYWGLEAQHLMRTDDQPLVFENLTTVNGHREHRDLLDYLESRKLPAIVIAGSGMCTGGRVVNYLKRFIGDPTTDLVFVGYQARGTPGHFISRGSEWVHLNGRRYDVRASVHRIQGYSAHGDQADLVEFVETMEESPKEIRLVHGDYQPKLILSETLSDLGYRIV